MIYGYRQYRGCQNWSGNILGFYFLLFLILPAPALVVQLQGQLVIEGVEDGLGLLE